VEEPVKRQVSYQWRLREVMAAHGMFTVRTRWKPAGRAPGAVPAG
jgi:hypothetical protein